MHHPAHTRAMVCVMGATKSSSLYRAVSFEKRKFVSSNNPKKVMASSLDSSRFLALDLEFPGSQPSPSPLVPWPIALFDLPRFPTVECSVCIPCSHHPIWIGQRRIPEYRYLHTVVYIYGWQYSSGCKIRFFWQQLASLC